MQKDNPAASGSAPSGIEVNTNVGINTGKCPGSSDSLPSVSVSSVSAGSPNTRSRSRSNASSYIPEAGNHMDTGPLSALQEKIIAFQESRLGRSTPTSPVDAHNNSSSYVSGNLNSLLMSNSDTSSSNSRDVGNPSRSRSGSVPNSQTPVQEKADSSSTRFSPQDLQRRQMSNEDTTDEATDCKSRESSEKKQSLSKKSEGVVSNINDLNTINRMSRLAQKMAALSTSQQPDADKNHPLKHLPISSSQYSFLTNADNKPLADSSFWKSQQKFLQQRSSAASQARSSAAQPQFSLLQQQQFQQLNQLQKKSTNAFSEQPPLPPFPLPPQNRQQSKTSPELSLAARRKNKFSANLSLSDLDSNQTKPLPLGSKTDPSTNPTDNNLSFKEDETNSFSNFNKYIDIKNGKLNFNNKASIHSHGVDFSSGKSFEISTNDMEVMGELGRGNYGTVTKALHKPTKIILAMKEVKLALDESKLRQISMELDILHKCESPFIVDFFGAFFIEGAVYMCIEYMDGGSLDQIYEGGIEEKKLAYITECVVHGLKDLKDNHNIIHRDVKPTNILVNTQGKVKLCDFGVSGNLVASKANTNIGCQSYMPPERITSNLNHDTSYTVQSDVWSLGITIIETGLGKFPYPRADSIMDQLNYIVYGESPTLSKSDFSEMAISFVKSCLYKKPEDRPNYSNLLNAEWLSYARENWFGIEYCDMQKDFADFVKERVQKNKAARHH